MLELRRRAIMKSSIDDIIGIASHDTLPCDVVFAKKNGSRVIIERDQNNWPSASKWSPIGVVVVPASHGVYGDEYTCGIVSLRSMSPSSPSSGTITSGTKMYWGTYSTDQSDMVNHKEVITTINNTTNTQSNGLSDNVGCIPCQKTAGSTPTRDNSPYSPSPFIGSDYKSGGYNSLYGTTQYDTSSKHNALADFDGIGNTTLLIAKHTSQSNWRTASTITNNANVGYAPAACCCARYKTTGTKAYVDCTANELATGLGFWYLPAAGELGYIPPNFCDINATITALKQKYNGSSLLELETTDGYTSSDEANYDGVKGIYLHTGRVDSLWERNQQFVRAFARIKNNVPVI